MDAVLSTWKPLIASLRMKSPPTFAKILGRPVRIAAVPRETWGSLFKSQGMKNPIPRIQMLDGFNEGWIEFERGESGSMKGNINWRPYCGD